MLGVERTGFVDEPRIGLLRVSRQLLYHFRRNLLGLLGRELFCSTCQQSREAGHHLRPAERTRQAHRRPATGSRCRPSGRHCFGDHNSGRANRSPPRLRGCTLGALDLRSALDRLVFLLALFKVCHDCSPWSARRQGSANARSSCVIQSRNHITGCSGQATTN